MYDRPRFLPAGDRAIVVEFGNEINPEINRRVRNLYLALQRSGIGGIGEMIPTYRSLLIYYDPMQLPLNQLIDYIQEVEADMERLKLPHPKIYVIPVIYGGEYGPDLEDVARYNQLTPGEVIQIHTATDYLIYMLGFAPGFPYLGGMSLRIATPRLKTPRTHIPAGSVGIADKQTGIYPIDSPGGWRIIGRTPVKLYDPYREPPVLLSAGNYVRFVSITAEDYHKIKAAVEQNTYTLQELPVELGG
ncbi:5-oxoprolinase subunit PxpB [Desulfofundulus salinus]|uniref:5-oxoprolinase subunit PxpB n=1 Tax=Desulfofundulus salinus TaxID=2419843 RepID=A0A494WRJ7_9FIRM|nr:5-oxoprolinase subunit PxpB [Desulfofundulus salinum]RKO65859.1 5-oxoprolinase subunit PxpB [Desulfofundulus salinum]